MIETERKFLVNSLEFIDLSTNQSKIFQGYLNSNPERAVRVRIMNNKGFLTVKGKSNKSGTSRFEWEKEIDFNEAQSLLLLCEEHILSKTRYIIPAEKHKYEVDVFHGVNNGLIVAEIELLAEDENFTKPKWLGKEVTGEERYYNSSLTKHPYSSWR